MRLFGEAKSILGHQTLQLMRRPYGVKGSVYVVTLSAFQRYLEGRAEGGGQGRRVPQLERGRRRPSQGTSRPRQHRRDTGKQPDWVSRIHKRIGTETELGTMGRTRTETEMNEIGNSKRKYVYPSRTGNGPDRKPGPNGYN
ncbi:hypothetical protein H5410_030278 [Solanum commersonii]|uniref:Uncharacterized protein n=1 Tax=Solanum commersonii TaxID=4109 RepID=A0A9J5YI67_SOLCO|nr:hypothetical protein H5410_030278 [Solanum commersonii]